MKFTIISILCIFTLFKNNVESTEHHSVCLRKLADGFANPVQVISQDKIFVVEQRGIIHIIGNDSPFLNITSKIFITNSFFDEKGLHTMVFHPNYKDNGRFFVMYSANKTNVGHVSRVSEFKVSQDPDIADPATEIIILEVPHPYDNNNGGQLFFRTDFFPDWLYITLGDGGGVSDPNNNAQRLDSLLGKILRIDISTHPYSVPCLNPFNSEVFAYGFRNPWRCSVNRKNQSEIFCGDSGQDGEEEIDIISKGGNYGWRIMEGRKCFIPSSCDKTNFTLPVYSYILDSPVSAVIGGVVVHAPGNFEGKYIFADLGEGLMVLENNEAEFVSLNSDCEQLSDFILSFADDSENRVFMSTTASFALNDKDGAVYEIQFSNGFRQQFPKFSLIIFLIIFISYIIL